MRRYLPELIASLVLIVLSLVAYARVWDFDFVNFDDADYVTDNLHVKAGLTADSVAWAFTTTHAANWHPLTWLSLQLDHQLYGLRAGGYHMTNLLLHTANAVLLFLALRGMTGAVGRSAVVAALFAVHPLHVESVAWISERKDVLSTFFWMLTLLAYAWYAERPAVGRYLLVVVPFALGLSAKPMLVTLPCVLLLLDYWPLRRIGLSRRDKPGSSLLWLLDKLPLFALSAASCVATLHAQQQAIFGLASLPLKIRMYNTLSAYLGYIGKMCAPFHLAAMYPYPRSWPVWQLVVNGVLLLAMTLLALRMVRRRPYILVGWLWYLGTLVPVIGLVQVGKQSMADRYTYIPLIGLFVVLVWGIGDLLERFPGRRAVSVALTTCVLLGCIILTWRQAATWRDADTLWNQALAATTDNSDAFFNVGALHESRGQLGPAAKLYRQTLRIDPDEPRAHCRLGVVLLEDGNAEEAVAHLRAGLQTDPRERTQCQLALGKALMKLGQFDEARRIFETILQQDPGDLLGHMQLGAMDYETERFDEAARHFASAVASNPNVSAAHNNLGTVRLRQGKVEEAADNFSEAVRVDGNNALAHCNLGKALAQLGRTEAAIDEYRTALRIQPDLERAQRELEECLRKQ